MIIKFQQGNNWVMFGEIDHLEYGVFPDNEGQSVESSRNILQYDPPELPTIGKHVWVSFFTKNMNDATLIYAYSPVYIMNDQGRTVETI